MVGGAARGWAPGGEGRNFIVFIRFDFSGDCFLPEHRVDRPDPDQYPQHGRGVPGRGLAMRLGLAGDDTVADVLSGICGGPRELEGRRPDL